MNKGDIHESIDLWYENYLDYYNEDKMPNFFPGGKESIENYLNDRVRNKSAVVLKDNANNILGYFSWLYFNFHNEKTAFCPIIGHCGKGIDKENIYSALYNYVSKQWVKNDTYNHQWMIYYKDSILQNLSYNMGFGAYVGNACLRIGSFETVNNPYKITQATIKECGLLYDLVEESRSFYQDSPIFLKREIITKDEISDLIKNAPIFIAWDKDKPIGFINININKKYDVEELSIPETGSISPLGIFIDSRYRNKGIGKALLNKIRNYCIKNSIEYVFVTFETANMYANRFWNKNFNPLILSVRRTVNKDANT
ncbi:GNAT family N-acetyltransferase [Brucepastera parasyntrophica]|uniref:GNAT family N-acetyltransferase n=1 Tax=Brucepastera parasyntrophica TaxID=2880008 RepID=UPI00210E62E1|nr:GNAT family N-acetyltransferase [Brucepastera parasyntrophica]ULQ61023.1 GNAT family N-acetyltransferase [Brucepastera parasyntrophica]